MILFVRKYNRYVRKNGVKHYDNNLMKFRRQSSSIKEENNKKDKENFIFYECGKPGHYKLDCPFLSKKKGKGQRNKPRQAFVVWGSGSESSSDEISSESDEEENYYFMANHRHGKKKDVECLDVVIGKWILDSGCSRHMTGDISLFSDFVAKKKGVVSYSDHKKGVILGKASTGMLEDHMQSLVS
ncbi:unnamed protein product [Vicia faba]|uniref:CCHC-type domain-containing protein n=1 Tax=Vicia faba TaxID=3906 RepID=A0AAV1AMM5_VICFA|nr:unnamed protein product [Vicia faba]